MVVVNNVINVWKDERMINTRANDVFVMNPLLYSDSEKYIWIGFSEIEHKEAQRMFVYLLQMNIYIDGFVTSDSKLSGLKIQ